MGTQVDEKLRVVEAAGIAAIVGASDLAHDLRDFGKFRKHAAGSLCDCNTGRWPGARRQCSTNPDRSFIQMGKELRADDATQAEEQHECERCDAHAKRESEVIKAPVKTTAIAFLRP